MQRWIALAVVLTGLVGCAAQVQPAPMPTRTPAPPTATGTALIASATPAAVGSTPTPPLETESPVTPESTSAPTVGTATETPPAAAGDLPPDHYWLERPIPTGYQDYADRTYSYGLTAGGKLRPHTAIDLPNPVGTPVVATGNAVVYYAGTDHEFVLGPQPDFYGNVIVLEMTGLAYNGQPIYTLYGHLDRIDVTTGQQVAVGETIGAVGGTGIANGGPHLHFEVRIGDPLDYFTSTRNPDLWIKPYYGFGTLAGRIVSADGTLLPDVSLIIRSENSVRYTSTYAGTENIPDEAWGENFTYADLPEGWYEVSTQSETGKIYRGRVYVYAGRTAWIELVFEQGTP